MTPKSLSPFFLVTEISYDPMNAMKRNRTRYTAMAIVWAWILFFGSLGTGALAQITTNDFSTQTSTNQQNDSFLHNTVNDQCCFQRLDGTSVDRGRTPDLFGFRAGFAEDGLDFRGDEDTHRGCEGNTCFSIPRMHAGADTSFGNLVPAGSSNSIVPFLLSSNIGQDEQLIATGGNNNSAPFNVHFSVRNRNVLFSRPEPGGTGNRLNTIQFGFDQSVESGVPGGDREGPITFLNGDDRDAGRGSGCRFCGSQGERVARQQDFEMFFTIDSKTDINGAMVGSATGTFQQTLTMSDVLPPNNTADCGSECIGQIGPITIQGSFTFDGARVNITTESIDIKGVPQAVGGTDPLGVPTNQTISVP